MIGLLIGAAFVSAGIYLSYRLFMHPEAEKRRAEDRIATLERLIKRVRHDFYKHKISEEKAKATVARYDAELQTLKKLKGLLDRGEELPVLGSSRSRQAVLVGLLLLLGAVLISAGLTAGTPDGAAEGSDELWSEEENMHAAESDGTGNGVSDSDRALLRLAAESNVSQAKAACDAIKGSETRDECYSDLSRRVGLLDAFNICKLIGGVLEREECYERLPTDKATRILKDPELMIEICKGLPSRDECLRRVSEAAAVLEPDHALAACLEVGRRDRRDQCLAALAGRVKGWNSNLAWKACDGIEDEYERYLCLKENWFSVPESVAGNLDLSMVVCNTLAVRRKECHGMVLDALIMFSPEEAGEFCEETGEIPREECYLRIANRTDEGDVALGACLNLTNSSGCLMRVAERFLDIDALTVREACSLLPAEDAFSCYNRTWLNSTETVVQYPEDSMAICASIGNRSDACYYGVARLLSDSSKQLAIKSCNLIKDEEIRLDCVREHG